MEHARETFLFLDFGLVLLGTMMSKNIFFIWSGSQKPTALAVYQSSRGSLKLVHTLDSYPEFLIQDLNILLVYGTQREQDLPEHQKGGFREPTEEWLKIILPIINLTGISEGKCLFQLFDIIWEKEDKTVYS